jgi:hypothetical protein
MCDFGRTESKESSLCQGVLSAGQESRISELEARSVKPEARSSNLESTEFATMGRAAFRPSSKLDYGSYLLGLFIHNFELLASRFEILDRRHWNLCLAILSNVP